MEGKKGELYIPGHTPDADDYIAGIGKFEGIVIGLSGIISLITAIINYAVTENVILSVVFAAIILALTITMVRRDKYNENLINKLMIVKHFYRSPKRYYYKFHNFYLSGETDDE